MKSGLYVSDDAVTTPHRRGLLLEVTKLVLALSGVFRGAEFMSVIAKINQNKGINEKNESPVKQRDKK